MTKNLFIKLFIAICLIEGIYANTQLQKDIENPDKLYKHSLEVIGQSNFLTDDTPETFENNVAVFIELSNLIERVDNFSSDLSQTVKSTLTNGKVINGEKVYHMSTLINIYHGISVKFNELNTYAKPESRINFLSSNDELRLGKDLLWLASYTKLYSSFYNNYQNYYTHINLRKIIKNLIETKRNSGQIKVDELFAMAAHILEKENRKVVREYFREFVTFSKTQNITHTEHVEILVSKINEKGTIESILKKNLDSLSNYTITDTLMTFFGKVTNAISGIFGNLVGKVRWRHGFFNKDEFVKQKLMSQLQPLDILFEKTPFALTDTFIPGHFGHAALYLGTEEQLKEIGMWDTKVIRPYQKSIRSGYIIVEAIRPGVGLTTMEKFMEIDEIAIVRQPDVTKNFVDTKNIYKRALDQIGKDYDFNFDVETTDKIVCSELLFFAYGQINWPIVYILGRPTISPDNLAELTFYDNSPIKFVLNYWSKKKGTLVEANINELASNIGYKKNEDRSTEDLISFDKKEYKCKTVVMKQLRSGSRRSRRVQRRVCGVIFERKIYNHAESFRDQRNGYFE